MKVLLAAVGLAVLSALSQVGLVSAASGPLTPAVSGISMTPAIQDKVLGAADKTTSFNVELFNHTDQPLALALSTTDFTSLNQTGGVAFLGNNTDSVTKEHGLSSFLKLGASNVALAPHAGKVVTARIEDVSKLAVGGHYAAILARAMPNNSTAKGNRVNLNQVLSSLVFLETAGQGTKNVSLYNPPMGKVAFSLPNSLNLVFKATGNTQAIPRGVVDVLHGDQQVLHGIINESSALVLPGSNRLLPTSLSGTQHPWWPGIYTVRIQYRYDGSLGITTYQKSFLYINVLSLVVMIIVLVLAVWLSVKTRTFWFKVKNLRPKSVQITATRTIIKISDKSHKGYRVSVKNNPKK